MNKELLYVFLPAISWILFALGGTQISNNIEGWKGWRRFILPTVFVILCLIFKIELWRAICVGLISMVVYSLGYGNGKTWLQRFIIGCLYALITVFIGLSQWNIVTALGFITLFILSNTKLTSSMFIWKICEGFVGALTGIQLAYLLIR